MHKDKLGYQKKVVSHSQLLMLLEFTMVVKLIVVQFIKHYPELELHMNPLTHSQLLMLLEFSMVE